MQNTGQLILLVKTDKYYTTRNATLEQFICIIEMDQVFFFNKFLSLFLYIIFQFSVTLKCFAL